MLHEQVAALEELQRAESADLSSFEKFAHLRLEPAQMQSAQTTPARSGSSSCAGGSRTLLPQSAIRRLSPGGKNRLERGLEARDNSAESAEQQAATAEQHYAFVQDLIEQKVAAKWDFPRFFAR
jgi:hypothetical protein